MHIILQFLNIINIYILRIFLFVALDKKII